MESYVSLYLAQYLLRHSIFPSSLVPRLLDLDLVKQSYVLELGSGVGLLPKLLFGSVANFSASYTATDQERSLPLLSKNLTSVTENNPTVQIQEVDWLDVSKLRKRGKQASEQYDLILSCELSNY